MLLSNKLDSRPTNTLIAGSPEFSPCFNVRMLFLIQRSGQQTLRELIICKPKQVGKQALFQMPDNEA